MNGRSTESREESVDEFRRQARSTGLTLPSRHRVLLSEVAAIVAVILLISVGVGVTTGWMNLRPPGPAVPGLFGPQSCAGQAGQRVDLQGSIPADAGRTLAESWSAMTADFLTSYGNCVRIGYSSGTGTTGLEELASRTVSLAVLQSAPTPGELGQLPDLTYVVPIGLTSVTIVYNLPGLAGPLNLNGTVLAEIYSGAIRQWNDPALEALNPSIHLPQNLAISVLSISNATPLNGMFSAFLSESSPEWNASYGSGDTLAWPVGTGYDDAPALVAALANQTGGIGYTETGLPLTANIAVADIENPAGNLSAPSVSSVTAAASGSVNTTQVAGGNWTGDSLLDSAGNGSYPLSFLEYLVVYRDLGAAFGGNLSLVAAQWELTFLWWVLTDGGYVTSPWGFDQLPLPVVLAAQVLLQKVAYDGKSVLDTESGESGGETGEF